MELTFYRQIFQKYSNIKFHENPSSWSGVVPCGQTDRHDEPHSRSSQFCERAQRILKLFPHSVSAYYPFPHSVSAYYFSHTVYLHITLSHTVYLHITFPTQCICVLPFPTQCICILPFPHSVSAYYLTVFTKAIITSVDMFQLLVYQTGAHFSVRYELSLCI